MANHETRQAHASKENHRLLFSINHPAVPAIRICRQIVPGISAYIPLMREPGRSFTACIKPFMPAIDFEHINVIDRLRGSIQENANRPISRNNINVLRVRQSGWQGRNKWGIDGSKISRWEKCRSVRPV